MNCRFGEVAYVVRSTRGHGCTMFDIGTPIETTRLSRAEDGGAFWLFPTERQCRHCGGWRMGYLDADLQPMRGPGPKPEAEPKERDRDNTIEEIEREAAEWLGVGS